MGNIGDLSTTTGSDVLGFRCPVGESKVLQVSDVQASTAGTMKLLSDCLVLPLQTVTSGIYVAAYEIPRLNYTLIAGSVMPAGEKLIFNTTSDAFESMSTSGNSEVKVTGILLQPGDQYKDQSVASEGLISFNGYGFMDQNSSSDALTAI